MASEDDQKSTPVLSLEKNGTENALAAAKKVLLEGGVVAIPTDTVYGVACLAKMGTGVRHLYESKGRHFHKPVAICVRTIECIAKHAKVNVSDALLRDLLPGPVTVMFERTEQISPDLNPGAGLVGVRIPDNTFVSQLVESVGDEPLALTSANRSTEASSLSIEDFRNMWGSIGCVVDAGVLGGSEHMRLGSTVVDLSVEGKYTIVRDGSALKQTVEILHRHALVEAPKSDEGSFSAVILDIEGTTTPISFVKDKLFPYVVNHIDRYLEQQWDTEECKGDVAGLVELCRADESKATEGCVHIDDPTDCSGTEAAAKLREQVAASVRWLVASDRKVTPLKRLQGHMWRHAYATGEVKGELFDDVLPVLRKWHTLGTPIYIYSSGSVEAQKLLFAHTTEGDLCPLLSGYFDTTTGPKTEAASYSAIAKTIGLEPEHCLFATDNPLEAQAALSAHMQVRVTVRLGNAPLTAEQKEALGPLCVTSFAEMPTPSAKAHVNGDQEKRKLPTEDTQESKKPRQEGHW
eukprot:comp20667_c0_seq1/m.26832 comp20667_c0_seq1/g.26832  ORF comp20667_c0_seq1/g.26832 comp20667_c0_seq1/m.26832 type:complete len:520 (-) comp20667_c0_seq1:126-1685(-)